MRPAYLVGRTWPFLLIALFNSSCANPRLQAYRDDHLLDTYRYVLGESYTQVDGINMCYQEYGQGDTVLILPGLGTSIDFWQATLPVLAKHFHVVALDLPGFGKSDKPDASYELSWICDKIVAFLNDRGLDHVSVIGGSMGGHLGLMLALDHADRVDKLVVMGATGNWPPPGPLLDVSLRLWWNERVVADYLRGHWADIFPKMCKHETELSRQLLRYQMALRADGARYALEGRASARALRSIFYASCRDQLANISMPVFLIWGDADQIHPIKDARYMHEKIPHSFLVIVPDSGHEVMMDQPEKFNEYVTSFLKNGTPFEHGVAQSHDAIH